MNANLPPRYRSETSKHRELVESYCEGYGLDIGFGGDAVNSRAIRMDLPAPYADTGDGAVQLGGDCRDLYWFRDGVLDYVYSSHVLEDFPEGETERVLREWARVVRPGGRVVLLLPDQQRYLRVCQQTGEGPNVHHSIAHFSLAYVKSLAERLGLRPIAEHPQVGEYSFVLVLEREEELAGAEPDLRGQLHEAWAQRDESVALLRQLEGHPLVRGGRALRRLFARARSGTP